MSVYMRFASQMKWALTGIGLFAATLLAAPQAQAQAPKISLSAAKTTAYVGEDLVFTLRFAARERRDQDYHVSFVPGARCVSGGATKYVGGDVIHTLACSFSKAGPRAVQGIGGFLNTEAGGSVDTLGNIRFGDWVPGSLSDPLDIVILPQIKPVLSLERLDAKALAGQPLRLRARLSGTDAAVPVEGKINFGGTTDYALDATDEAVGELRGLSPGTIDLVARLTVASPAYEKVQSLPLSVLVEKGGSVVLLKAKSTTVHGSELVELSGQVQGYVPAGRVTLVSGARVLGDAPLDSNGLFSLRTRLAVGSYSVVAQFPGDNNNEPGSSAPVALTVDNATPASLSLSSTLKDLPAGARTVLVAQVGGNSPSGTVKFYEGTTLLGTAPVIEGMATLSVSFGTPGAHAVRAEYSGDANNIGLGSAGTVDFSVSTPPAPGGSSTTATYQYDRVGNPVVRTDPRGYSQHTVYDAANRPLMDINAVGGVRQQRYNGLGMPVLVSDADGVAQQTTYDNFGRVAKTRDGLGNVQEYGYDLADGRPGSEGSPIEIKTASLTQKYRFDAGERLSSQQLQDTTEFAGAARGQTQSYDLAGRTTSRVDAYGKAEKYGYNAFGQQTEITDRLGGKTLIRYDARGNVIDVENAKGAHYRFEYDKADRLVKEVKPLGQTTRYEYDAQGNLLRKTDPLGRVQKYSYDAQDRLTEVQHLRADSSLWQKTTFQWQDNLLVAWGSWDYSRPEAQQQSSATLSYDDEGRKTGETVSLPNPAGARYSMSYRYGYSAAGRKTKIVWPDGTELQYGYAAHGGLERVSIPGAGSLSVGEFRDGVPTIWQLPGGGTRSLQVDGLQQLRGQTVKSPTQQPTLQLQNSFGLEFELQQRQRTDVLDGASSTDDLTAVHDDDQRLTEAARKGSFSNETERFTLDAVGNRKAHSRTSGEWTYDANDRLLLQGSGPSAIRYTYDDAGNTVQRQGSDRTLDFGYDAENRLIWVRQADGAWVARYGYDPLGRRVWKEQYRDGAGLPLAQAKRTYFLYSDEGLLAEARQAIALTAEGQATANLAPVLHTQYGPQPDAPFTTALLLAKTLDSNAQQQVVFFHNDHLGAPLQATNAKGQVLWAAAYEPFGQATVVSPAPTAERPAVEINLRLSGQYWDDETGLHYNFHRNYGPSIGRYVQSDPIGLNGGVNTYVYVAGNPVSSVDPRGLDNANPFGPLIPPGGVPTTPPPDECSTEKKTCVDVIVTSHHGVCDNNPDPMCAAGMKAAGFEGPYYSYKTKVDTNCLLRFGVGVKGGSAVGGEVLKKYGPTYATRAANFLFGRKAAVYISYGSDAAAGFFSSTPVVVVTGAFGIASVIDHCTCSRQ